MAARLTHTLVALAGGLGSRYGGAKQVEAVGPSGETILDYSVHDALHAGFSRVVVVIRPELKAEITAGLVRRWSERTSIMLAEQPPRGQGVSSPEAKRRPWGTAHAVLSAAPSLSGSFAVINADDFYGRSAIACALQACSTSDLSARDPSSVPEYAVVAFPLRDTLRQGQPVSRAILQVDASGMLGGIAEVSAYLDDGGRPTLVARPPVYTVDPGALVSMNMWAFTPAVVPQIEKAFADFRRDHAVDSDGELMLPHFVQGLLHAGAARVRVEKGEGSPTGLTHTADRSFMRSHFQHLTDAGEYPSPVWI